MLKWLRKLLNGERVIIDIKTKVDIINAAKQALNTNNVMIISLSKIDEGQKVELLCPEGVNPIKILGFAHEALIDNPLGKKYSREQIQMQMDFWLDQMIECEAQIKT